MYNGKILWHTCSYMFIDIQKRFETLWNIAQCYGINTILFQQYMHNILIFVTVLLKYCVLFTIMFQQCTHNVTVFLKYCVQNSRKKFLTKIF